ncbi:MAG TPA: hypothetical protein ENN64_00220 [bacterium]|nr:hypothetical protein [bacterium]
MEIIVESGVGYRDADDDKRSEIDRIPLDADFTPVKKVMIEVGKARKGQETELDSVLIQIETDGSISPKDALLESVKMIQVFAGKVMVALGMSELEVEELEEESSDMPEIIEEEDSIEENEVYTWRIEDLPISKRAKTALLNGSYEIVGDLVGVTEKDLQKLPGFGAKSLSEVLSLLNEYGITLTENKDE